MDASEILLTLAEVCVVLAGFIGIVVQGIYRRVVAIEFSVLARALQD